MQVREGTEVKNREKIGENTRKKKIENWQKVRDRKEGEEGTCR